MQSFYMSRHSWTSWVSPWDLYMLFVYIYTYFLLSCSQPYSVCEHLLLQKIHRFMAIFWSNSGRMEQKCFPCHDLEDFRENMAEAKQGDAVENLHSWISLGHQSNELRSRSHSFFYREGLWMAFWHRERKLYCENCKEV